MNLAKNVFPSVIGFMAFLGPNACLAPKWPRSPKSLGTPLNPGDPLAGNAVHIFNDLGNCTGGVLANHRRFVTTAAHCVYGAKEVFVDFDMALRPYYSPTLATSQWFVHPGYTVYRNMPQAEARHWENYYDLDLVVLPQEAPTQAQGATLNYSFAPLTLLEPVQGKVLCPGDSGAPVFLGPPDSPT